MSAFGSDGFVHLKGFFAPALVAEVLANVERYVRDVVPRAPDTDAFYEDKERPETLKQLIRVHHHDEYFRRLLEEGRFPETAAELLGELVRPVNQQVFIKPPGGASRATPPHQDGFYFHLEPCVATTLWLALDDVDAENGCLRYVRGSHRRGVRPHGRTGTLGFSQGVSDFGTAEDRANEVACVARAGDPDRPPCPHHPPGGRESRLRPVAARIGADLLRRQCQGAERGGRGVSTPAGQRNETDRPHLMAVPLRPRPT